MMCSSGDTLEWKRCIETLRTFVWYCGIAKKLNEQ